MHHGVIRQGHDDIVCHIANAELPSVVLYQAANVDLCFDHFTEQAQHQRRQILRPHNLGQIAEEGNAVLRRNRSISTN